MSAARELAHTTLNTIHQRFNLHEMQGKDGGPFLRLSSTSPMMLGAPVGEVRLFSGGPISKMVYIGMAVPPIGLDSHMVFAFTAPESPVPHFTLDSVLSAPDFAFHLDLIPRVDLGANLAYIDAVLAPLNDEFERVAKMEGLTAARLTPRQYAIMSPWMLAYRANEQAFAKIPHAVNVYLDHWFKLVENGLPAEIAAEFTPTALAERDRRNRSAIFNPDVDKVWAQVDMLVGVETSTQMRELLRLQEMPQKA